MPSVPAWHTVWPGAPAQLSFSIPSEMRSAGSPMSSAASALRSISGKSGSTSAKSGATRHLSAHRMRVSACVLRELLSSAKVSTCSIGFFATSSRLRTWFLEAIAMSGRIANPGMRWYSIAGMIATSARPARKSSAHCEGTVKDNSYLPRSGPLVKPQTSGAVFRYCTMEMRGLVKLEPSRRTQYSRQNFSPRQVGFVVKPFDGFGGFGNVEAFALLLVRMALLFIDFRRSACREPGSRPGRNAFRPASRTPGGNYRRRRCANGHGNERGHEPLGRPATTAAGGDACQHRDDCGEDRGDAEAGRVLQPVLGCETGETLAGN